MMDKAEAQARKLMRWVVDGGEIEKAREHFRRDQMNRAFRWLSSYHLCDKFCGRWEWVADGDEVRAFAEEFLAEEIPSNGSYRHSRKELPVVVVSWPDGIFRAGAEFDRLEFEFMQEYHSIESGAVLKLRGKVGKLQPGTYVFDGTKFEEMQA